MDNLLVRIHLITEMIQQIDRPRAMGGSLHSLRYTTSHKSLFCFPGFVLALPGIRRLVVDIKATENDDLIPLRYTTQHLHSTASTSSIHPLPSHGSNP